jgi:hypothetical protein
MDRACEGVELLRRAVEIEPGFDGARYLLGVAYLQLGARASAVRELEVLRAAKSPYATDLFDALY